MMKTLICSIIGTSLPYLIIAFSLLNPQGSEGFVGLLFYLGLLCTFIFPVALTVTIASIVNHRYRIAHITLLVFQIGILLQIPLFFIGIE